jgi:glycine dehydrogenase subunit 2
MHVRAYSYIHSWGSRIREVSEHAILNANYLQALLKDTFDLAYNRRCAHEFVVSSRRFGEKSALNIAKRLMDYGFHPPTIYFPLIVQEALMIEPTETESKETLDRFVLALKKITSEIKEDPETVKQSPLSTPVGRLDEVAAARRPNLRWQPF